jgi:PAS domain S-box-containing protein
MAEGKILVIDDEIGVRHFLARLLQDYQVELAANGREGLEWAARDQFDVALVDIELPDMDGMEVLRSLRARDEDLETLIIIAHPALEKAMEAVRLGAFDYLLKPLDNERVLISVQNALSAHHLALINKGLLRDLQRANAELERRVDERTAELANANGELQLDIIERKRAEEALRASQERYRELADSIGDVFFAMDKDLRYTYWNGASEELTGIASEDAIGRSLYELFPDLPETKRAERVYLDVLRTQQPQSFETEYPLRGEAHFFEISAYPSGDGVSVFTKDIAERKRAEEALRRSLGETAHSQRLLLALSQAVQAVQRARTPDEIYRTVGDEVATLGYHAMIFIPTDDGTHLTMPYMTFQPALLSTVETLTGLSAHDNRIPLVPGSLLQRIIAEGGTVFAERTAEHIAEAQLEPVGSLAHQLAALLGVEQGILARLRVTGEAHRLLVVSGAGLTEADVPAVTTFANQAAIALENARLLEQVQAGRERLRRLAQQLVSAQEDERHRLSRELHDQAGQALTALNIHLDLIRSDLPVESGSLRQRLREGAALTETIMEQLRSLARDLRPPALDALGLSYALEGYCRDFASRTQLPVHYVGAELPDLPEAVDICLYRFLQEALTNASKHAHANQVSVALRSDAEAVSLLVEDDGQGFEVKAGMASGIGLLGMQERLEPVGGRLEIQSRPGQGTRLTAWVPLE